MQLHRCRLSGIPLTAQRSLIVRLIVPLCTGPRTQGNIRPKTKSMPLGHHKVSS